MHVNDMSSQPSEGNALDETLQFICFAICAIEAGTFGIHGVLFLTDFLHGWGNAFLTGWVQTPDGGLDQVESPPALPPTLPSFVGFWMLTLSILAVSGWPVIAQGMLAMVLGGIFQARWKGPLRACPGWMALPSICYFEFALVVAFCKGGWHALCCVALLPALGWFAADFIVGPGPQVSRLREGLLEA